MTRRDPRAARVRSNTNCAVGPSRYPASTLLYSRRTQRLRMVYLPQPAGRL